MSREKQIEEMAKVLTKYEYSLCERLPKDKCLLTSAIHAQVSCDYCKIAEHLYTAGYRKQSEGEWKYNPDGMDWGLGAWECSVCRCRNDNLPMDENINPMRWAGAKFCPNCGAKMKGGE